MARIKRGVVTHRKHRKVLQLAKGYRMTKNRLIKVANEAVLHAGEYAFAGRKHRKRQLRRLWILRLNAALSQLDLKYSSFISLLKKQKVNLDRKMLAFFAKDQALFAQIVKEIKK
jgi:large subunit ribosomal protein L20